MQVSRKRLQVSRKCQVSPKRTAVYTYRPYMHPSTQGAKPKPIYRHPHPSSIYGRTRPKARRRRLYTTHYVPVLYIQRRKPAGEGYLLRITYPYYISSAESPPERAICTTRITYPYYVSSAESPPERAMKYALRIRIIYQAPNHNTRRTQHT